MAKHEIRTLLYYPTINVPTNSWLRHALLYWDDVSSIVPKNIIYENELSTDIRYLMDEGQFNPFRPDDLIRYAPNYHYLEAFKNEFKEVVSSRQFQSYVHRQPFSLSRIKNSKLPDPSFARIHLDKASYDIFEFLVDQQLAIRQEINGWYFFERNTALLYMSLLAKYLSEIAKNPTTISTDYGIYQKFNFGNITQKDTYPVISINLSSILPMPRANVSLEKIIDFKRKRKDNLDHFRKILLEFQSKIQKAKTNSELKELTISFKENIKVGIKDLSSAMKDARMEVFLKSLKSLINFKSPTSILTAAAIADEKYHFAHMPITYKTLGIAAVAGIEISTQYVELRNKLQSKHRESPFAYLYQAQRAGIMKK